MYLLKMDQIKDKNSSSNISKNMYLLKMDQIKDTKKSSSNISKKINKRFDK